jgi:Ca2+-transporting ATPase
MVTPTGLTNTEVKVKLRQYGLNEIQDTNKTSVWKVLFRQIRSNFVIYLLVLTAIVSILIGKSITAYVISLVIGIVVFTGFIQEYKAEKAINALKQMIMPISRIIRNGKEQEVPSKEIVPGDIILLRTGEKVPADCIVLDANELKLNESILTGESQDVSKVPTKDERNASEESLLYMGSFVANGKCIAKVIHTGMNTKFGKIASMISKAEKKLPLQEKVNKISKYMIVVGLTSSIVTGLILLLRADTINSDVLINVLILVIALSVSSFPEGFPVVLTSTLAMGVNRMARQNAVVNRMSIIETLGETTVICSDKTGTLTTGEMTVKKIATFGNVYDVTGVGYEAKGEIKEKGVRINVEKHIPLHYLLTTAVLCNDSNIERLGDDALYKVAGTSTEGALLILGAKNHIFKEDFNEERTEEIPFNSDRKMMSISYRDHHEHIVHAKGAPEIILQKCTHIQTDSGITPLTELEKKQIISINNEMTSAAFRTLAFAYKIDKNHHENYTENNLVYLGLVAMEDPPREEAREAIKLCKHGGIKVKMITGDNKETAQAIANQIDIKGAAIDGKNLDYLSDEELKKQVNNIAIFARVKPEHKLRIVKALKDNGEIVTMTGDGVNDAPALKEAHIGVAMGKNGTDVSRSVADITLKDDNFATIVVAIKEGRTIFNNIRKFITYQLSCNLSDIIVLFFGVLLGPLFGWYVPVITALQVLFMNIATDNIPAITLGFTPSSMDIMKEKPRKKAELLSGELIRVIIFNGSSMAAISIGVLFFTYNVINHNPDVARTTALVSMIIMQIANAFNFRSFRFRAINTGVFINKFLVYASVISLIATFGVVYTPLRHIFETTPIEFESWIIAIFSGITILFIVDIFKIVNNKTHFLLQHTT